MCGWTGAHLVVSVEVMVAGWMVVLVGVLCCARSVVVLELLVSDPHVCLDWSARGGQCGDYFFPPDTTRV